MPPASDSRVNSRIQESILSAKRDALRDAPSIWILRLAVSAIVRSLYTQSPSDGNLESHSELDSKYIEQNYNLIPSEYLQIFLTIYAMRHLGICPSPEAYARASLSQPMSPQ